MLAEVATVEGQPIGRGVNLTGQTGDELERCRLGSEGAASCWM
jgi:hypothetical protein